MVLPCLMCLSASWLVMPCSRWLRLVLLISMGLLRNQPKLLCQVTQRPRIQRQGSTESATQQGAPSRGKTSWTQTAVRQDGACATRSLARLLLHLVRIIRPPWPLQMRWQHGAKACMVIREGRACSLQALTSLRSSKHVCDNGRVTNRSHGLPSTPRTGIDAS